MVAAARHRIARNHLVPALEAALTSLLLGTEGPRANGGCVPVANRRVLCAVTANAKVAEPGATVEVLDYARAYALRPDSAGVRKPVLAEFQWEGPAAVTVHFLRN